MVFGFAGADVGEAVAFEFVAVLVEAGVAAGVAFCRNAVVDEAATGGRGAEGLPL